MENALTMRALEWPEPPAPLNWRAPRTWTVFMATAVVLAIVPVPLLIVSQIIWSLLGLAGGFVPGLAFGAGLAVSVGAILYPMATKWFFRKQDITAEFTRLKLLPDHGQSRWTALPLTVLWGLVYGIAGVLLVQLVLQTSPNADAGACWGSVFGLCGLFSIPLARRALELFAVRTAAS